MPVSGERVQNLRTSSVFVTAVDPCELLGLTEEVRAAKIRTEVAEILLKRGKNKQVGDIEKRSESAVNEILSAIGRDGEKQYSRVFHSDPEGPDGEDHWTCAGGPIGKAKRVAYEFAAFVKDIEKHG